MTVVGLHPEELFDKLLEGDITGAERERLRLHLDACEVCRFEYAARLDFHAEALALAAQEPPPLLPLRAPVPVAAPLRRRRRSRRLVWGLAAAALISASGAVASVVTGAAPWHTMSMVLSPVVARGSQPARATNAARAGLSGCKGADCSAATQQAGAAPSASGVAAAASEEREPGLIAEHVPARAGHAQGHVSRAPRGSSSGTLAASPEPPALVVTEAAKEPADREATSSAKLFGEANQARRSGDIGRASGLYHLLQDQFPGSAEAELSRVTLALLLLDSGDAQGALTGFERYLAGASRGLEAEALVGRARALGRLGRRDLEASAWQEVRRKYPRSIYGRQATERLSSLGLP